MSTTNLNESIRQYNEQLCQVNEALKLISDNDSAERDSLENLKSDLTELLQLTKETLNEQTISDEMKLFMSEINHDNEDDHDKDDEEIAEDIELNSLIGKKCAAPFLHSWGSINYHNALICSIVDRDTAAETKNDGVQVKILFTNPTHREMLPCSYYFDGDCRFDADKCRFSHGETVLFNELKDYNDPDFTLLQKPKYPVLAKKADKIWHKGHVVSCNMEKKTCIIRLHGNKEITNNFEDIFPLREDNETSNSDLSSNDEDDNDEEDYYAEIHRAQMIEKSLFSPVSDQALGEWEKHTKGFGSKMMQKFGYIIGTGLGQNGEGIIVPISAQILPPGRSLDHCMELRNQANGDKNLFSVERKLKQQKIKQDKINEKAYSAPKKDFFNYINESIFGGSTSNGNEAAATQSKKKDLKIHEHLTNHSHKNLNVVSFKLSEDIRKKEKEIQKVQESLNRHTVNTPVYEKFQLQLQEKTRELNALKRSESVVSKEQTHRKDKSKLTIF